MLFALFMIVKNMMGLYRTHGTGPKFYKPLFPFLLPSTRVLMLPYVSGVLFGAGIGFQACYWGELLEQSIAGFAGVLELQLRSTYLARRIRTLLSSEAPDMSFSSHSPTVDELYIRKNQAQPYGYPRHLHLLTLHSLLLRRLKLVLYHLDICPPGKARVYQDLTLTVPQCPWGSSVQLIEVLPISHQTTSQASRLYSFHNCGAKLLL